MQKEVRLINGQFYTGHLNRDGEFVDLRPVIWGHAGQLYVQKGVPRNIGDGAKVSYTVEDREDGYRYFKDEVVTEIKYLGKVTKYDPPVLIKPGDVYREFGEEWRRKADEEHKAWKRKVEELRKSLPQITRDLTEEVFRELLSSADHQWKRDVRRWSKLPGNKGNPGGISKEVRRRFHERYKELLSLDEGIIRQRIAELVDWEKP